MTVPTIAADLANAVTLDDIRSAANLLDGVAHRTPVLTSRTLDERTGASIFLKAEIFQRMGAFKFRGAYNAIARLNLEARARGVVGFSSGNHAQAVALAAQLLDTPATIVMPSDAPSSKLEATRGYGAEVVTYDRYTEDRQAISERLAADLGATLIPPFDHPLIVAGAGTAALELIEQAGDLDMLFVSVGGGGLLSGCAVAAVSLLPAIQVYGVEPEAGNDWAQSIAAGKRIALSDVPRTIADGQQTDAPGELTFALAQPRIAGIALVSDAEIRATVAFLFERLKIVVEPSGACALAAVIGGKVEVTGRRVGVILTGGNVSPDRFAALFGATTRG